MKPWGPPFPILTASHHSLGWVRIFPSKMDTFYLFKKVLKKAIRWQDIITCFYMKNKKLRNNTMK